MGKDHDQWITIGDREAVHSGVLRATRGRTVTARRCPATHTSFLEPPSEQAHLPAEQPSSREDPRLPAADAHPCRPRDSRVPPQQGSRPSVRLICSTGHDVLPTDNRLRRREDFATAVRRGRRAGRPLLVVHLRSGSTDPHASGESAPPTRAGFVVSKAVGGAVVRNQVKRRLRHLMRERLSELRPGSLVVVRALPGAGDADHAQLARDLDAALQRLQGRGAR